MVKQQIRKNSEQIFEQARELMVGGVNSPVRCFKGVGGNPLVMKSANRTQLVDQDNNEYTDYCLSWGASILGHAHRNVTLAAKKTVERGVSFGATTRHEVKIAQLIVDKVPSIERIRFVNSGTEATMSALRLARGFTKRPMVIKFDGCYHGHVDDLLTQAGSGVAALQQSSSDGIPQEHVKNTLSLPYNDIQTLEQTIAQHKDNIAAVIIEPVAGNMGVIPATSEFLTALRKLTHDHGIVLIFDEIMTGFRPSFGGVQADYGIIPDMTCLGKIIGGGFPIGAYGGRADIMACLAPMGGVYQAGTFSGNPVVMASGYAALRALNDDMYTKLNTRCDAFIDDINGFFDSNGIDAHMSHYFSMMSLRFRREPVRNYADAQDAQGHEQYARLFHHLLDNGIYFPPADLEAFFVSTLHTRKHLRQLSHALKTFFKSGGSQSINSKERTQS